METLESMIDHLKDYEISYAAEFDTDTGRILAVGPSVAFQGKTNVVELENDLAEDILTAKINISNCFIDLHSGKLEITESKSIRKIDDVLHRISLYEFSEKEVVDVYVTYNKRDKTLKFELSKELGGTKEIDSDKIRSIHWSGDTMLNFYLTKYNDPHWIFDQYDVIINELAGKSKIYENVVVPEKFSLFTRRILKNYVIEIQ